MGTRGRHAVARGADESAADLTEHLVVHRGIRVDLARLARAARDLASTSPDRDAACRRGLQEYLASIAAMVDSHCRVESDVLTPMLTGLVESPSAVPPVDGAALTTLLHQATETATGFGPARPVSRDAANLAAVLDRAAEAAIAFTVRQEQAVHPLIREYMRAEDYRWIRDQFLTDLPPGLLSFAVPWTLRHATRTEQSRLLDHRDPAICVMQQIFQQRFAALEGLAFGVRHLEPF